MRNLLHPRSWFSRTTATYLILVQPIVTLPSMVWSQAARPLPVAERKFNDLPDAFKEDWVPPAPVLSPREVKLNKAAIASAVPDFSLPQGRALSAKEIREARVLQTPLRATSGRVATEGEVRELGELLRLQAKGSGLTDPAAASRLKAFVAKHPQSGFGLSLLIEAAETEWRHGYFVRSLETYRQAWELGRGLEEINDRRLAEMALSSLLQHRSRLGQKDELRKLIESVKDRPLGGAANDALLRAKEVAWFLEHKPERNVFCGFTAANAVCVPRGENPVFPDVHDEEEKATFIRDGLSAYELKVHSHEVGGTLRVVKRGAGSPIVAPSVVHFNFSHYSAVTEVKDGKYRVTDEHLDFDSWVPQESIDEQGSGYFLVPNGVEVPKGYVEVSDAEAKTIFGRHCSHAVDAEGEAKTNSDKCPEKGMAVHSFNLLNAGLMFNDRPVVHRPPYGPEVAFHAQYNQRSTTIGDLQSTGNLGPRWSHALQEAVSLTGTGTPNTQVRWLRGDGTYFLYTYNSSTSSYSQKYKERPQLVYLTAPMGGPGYQLNFPDGSRKVFKQGNLATPTRYYLTQVLDPVGNAITLQYDGSLRLATVTDALGQVTTIGYTPESGDNVTGDTLKIRQVTDPFSRVAKFKYTSTGQLHKIIDPVGIVSEFRYIAGDFIDQLTTPYGATQYSYGEMPGINAEPGKWVESRDAEGEKERVEQNDLALPDTYVANPAAPTAVSVNGTNVSFLPKNDNLFYRNTFYWNRQQMRDNPGDYNKARIYNWLASTGDTITAVLGSIKEPLEGRIWFNYPGQTSAHAIGNVTMPSKTVRAVEDATGATIWSMAQTSYNDLGKLTGTVDPKGRELKYEYYANNQDLQYIKVKNGGAWETLLTISQYKSISGQSVHLPEIMTDAAGQQTQLSYNDKGQVTQVTVSKGASSETTQYTYDENLDGTADAQGYLVKVEHTSPWNPSVFVTLQSVAYDAAKRIRTVTDGQGYALTYDYDSLNRVTLVTHPDATTEQVVYQDGVKQTLDVWAAKDRAGRWQRMRYGQHRELLMQLDPMLRLTQYEWCLCGHLNKLIDPTGKITQWKRDGQGRVTEKLLSDGNKYLFSYEPLSGLPSTIAYPQDVLSSQNTLTLRYHVDGQLQKKDYRDAAMADVTLGAADYLGRPTSMSDGIGTTTKSYVALTGAVNGAGQLASTNGPLVDDTLRYTYDWRGRETKSEVVADDGVTVTRTEEVELDSLGRSTALVNNLGAFTSSYNNGNLSALPDEVSLPGGFNTLYTRYAANAGTNALQLQAIHHRQGTTTVQKHDYSYDLAGNIKTWDRTNGAANITSWAMQHDQADQLNELDETLDSVAQKKEAWSYDAAGNVRSSMSIPAGMTGSLQMRSLTGRNQLTQLGGVGKTVVEGTTNEAAKVEVNGEKAAVTKLGPTGPWRFQKEQALASGANSISIEATDGQNNVTTKSYTVSVGAVANQVLTYDANGNVLEVKDGGGAVVRAYEWDALNRLLAIQSASAPAPGVTRTEFSYDANGRRVGQIEKEHNGTTWQETAKFRYIWKGLELVQKRDGGSGGVLTNYFQQGEQHGTEKIAYLSDHLGTNWGWYRVSDGVVGSATYNAFGEVIALSAGPRAIEKTFGGLFSHEVTGLLFAVYRSYDPKVGRWISEDPIQEVGGQNLYSYVGNNPVLAQDPSGLIWHIVIGTGIGVLAGGIASMASGKGFWEGALIGGTAGFIGSVTLNPIAGLLGAETAAGFLAAGALSGGAAGLGSGVVGELFDMGRPCGEFSWGDVLKSTIAGAVGGAPGGLVGGLTGTIDETLIATKSLQEVFRAKVAQGLMEADLAIYLNSLNDYLW